MFSSDKWFGAEAGFYSETIDQSLRLDGTSAHLSKTYSTTASSTTDFVMSLWFKAILSGTGDRMIASSYDGATVMMYWQFQSDRKLRIYIDPSSASSNEFHVTTDMVFRDSTNWYNICLVLDMSQSSNVDKAKIYVNGTQASTTETYSTGTPTTQNVIKSGTTFNISKYFTSSQYIDGYIAEVNIIDGSANYTDFGESKNGVWIPKPYTGSYGNNGARLTFADSSALGDDTSGNTNDFTPSGLASTDVVPDSPTNNFAVLNPLAKSSSITLAEGNLKWSSGSHNYQGTTATIAVPTSGKWYFECLVVTAGAATSHDFGIGLVSNSDDSAMGSQVNNNTFNNGAMYVSRGDSGSRVMVDGSTLGGSNTLSVASGGIMQCAFDADSGKIWFGENNSWYDASYSTNTTANAPSAGANQTATIDANHEYVVQFNGYTNQYVVVGNFGQDSSFAGNKTSGSANGSDANGIGDFFYDPPNSFLALSSSNLPDTTISPNQDTQATDHFDTILRVGHGTSGGSTPANFKADWIWEKARNSAQSHYLIDSSRGIVDGSTQALITNTTNAELTANWYKPPTSSSLEFNTNDWASSFSLVDWIWKANGGTTSSNTDGTITSTVQANTDAGFSIVTYTGTGSAGTIGHGLGKTPAVLITKNRSDGGEHSLWVWWHGARTGGFASDANYLYLNTTSPGGTSSGGVFYNGTQINTTTYGLLSGTTGVNKLGDNYLCLAFAEIEGYSKMGTYTGNNSTDGTFVYTGFRPAWIMTKRTDTTGNWLIIDNKRDVDNVAHHRIIPNKANAEATSVVATLDILSNGFKRKDNNVDVNANGGTYIYMAFAEQPFKFSNAR